MVNVIPEYEQQSKDLVVKTHTITSKHSGRVVEIIDRFEIKNGRLAPTTELTMPSLTPSSAYSNPDLHTSAAEQVLGNSDMSQTKSNPAQIVISSQVVDPKAGHHRIPVPVVPGVVLPYVPAAGGGAGGANGSIQDFSMDADDYGDLDDDLDL